MSSQIQGVLPSPLKTCAAFFLKPHTRCDQALCEAWGALRLRGLPGGRVGQRRATVKQANNCTGYSCVPPGGCSWLIDPRGSTCVSAVPALLLGVYSRGLSEAGKGAQPQVAPWWGRPAAPTPRTGCPDSLRAASGSHREVKTSSKTVTARR